MAKVTHTQKYNPETHFEEIEITYPKEDFDKNFEIAFAEIQKVATSKGFRKGSVPKNVVLANYYSQIADRSIEISVNDALVKIGHIEPHPMDSLNVKSVNQAGKDGEDGLLIVVAYLPYPEIKLGDYSKLKVAKPEQIKADAAEVDKETLNVWHFYAKKINPEIKREEFDPKKIDAEFFEKSGLIKENPEINSYEKLREFVESYVNNNYIQNSQLDWENSLKSEIVKASGYEKVEGLVDRELERRVENYLQKFKDVGMDPAEYLKNSNVDLDELKKEWRAGAEEDIKFELVLQEYGKSKGFKPTEEELKEELSKLDGNTRKMYNSDEDRLKSMITYYYVNSKSFKEIADQIEANSEKVTEGKSSEKKSKVKSK